MRRGGAVGSASKVSPGLQSGFFSSDSFAFFLAASFLILVISRSAANFSAASSALLSAPTCNFLSGLIAGRIAGLFKVAGVPTIIPQTFAYSIQSLSAFMRMLKRLPTKLPKATIAVTAAKSGENLAVPEMSSIQEANLSGNMLRSNGGTVGKVGSAIGSGQISGRRNFSLVRSETCNVPSASIALR